MTILMTGGDKPLGLLDILEDAEQYGEFVESLSSRDPYTAICQGGSGGPCCDADCEKCWPSEPL